MPAPVPVLTGTVHVLPAPTTGEPTVAPLTLPDVVSVKLDAVRPVTGVPKVTM